MWQPPNHFKKEKVKRKKYSRGITRSMMPNQLFEFVVTDMRRSRVHYREDSQ